jgi:hypothetical protein
MRSKSYGKELKRQFRIAISAAIGFIIAFAWREAIFDSMLEIVSRWTNTTNIQLSEIYTAIFITIIGVFLIFITSRILKER